MLCVCIVDVVLQYDLHNGFYTVLTCLIVAKLQLDSNSGIKLDVKNRHVQTWEIIALVFVIFISGFAPISRATTGGNFPDDFPFYSERNYTEYKNIFLEDRSRSTAFYYGVYNGEEQVYIMQSHYTICKTEEIAETIFERYIVYEQVNRSNEYAYIKKKNILTEEHPDLDKVTPYYNYKDAVKEYTKIDDYYVLDELLSIEKYVVYRYKNLVMCLVIGEEDEIYEDIGGALKQFVDYYNNPNSEDKPARYVITF